jgi:hypothetical protein
MTRLGHLCKRSTEPHPFLSIWKLQIDLQNKQFEDNTTMKYPTCAIASPISVDALLTKASGTSPVKEEIPDNMKAFSSSTATVEEIIIPIQCLPIFKGSLLSWPTI